MLKIWKIILVAISLKLQLSVTKAGCTHTTNGTLCLDTAVCTNYIDVQYNDINYDRYSYYRYTNPCDLYSIDGRYVMDMSVTYLEGSDTNNEIPAVHNTNILKTIKRLNISNSNYISFPILAEMTNLVYLNISHNDLTSAKLSSSFRFLNLMEIDMSFNLIKDIYVKYGEFPMSTLTKLNLSHNEIVQIQDAIFSEFQNLQYLDFSYNKLDSIGSLTFDGVRKLIHLNLEHNYIKEIGSSLFRFSELQKLYLNNNKIKTLLNKNFNNLHQLQELNLSYNILTSIENQTFDKLTYLMSIDLQHNKIKCLDENLFKYTNLSKINLSSNNLQTIPKHIFKGKSLSFIDLRSNNLEGELSSGIFEGLSNILELDLSYQSIASLEDFAFSGLEKVEVLRLNNNVLRNISNKSFSSLEKLQTLDLSFNEITVLNFDISDLINLDYLSLNTNLINMVSQSFFNNSEEMIYLDISNNNISNILPHTFKAMSSLENLDISNNRIAGVLEGYTFQGLHALPILDISFSFITEINNNSFYCMNTLHTLNISHSALKDIHYNSFVNTDKLEIIDLSYNFITMLNVNVTTLKNLKILHLAHNLITFLSSITNPSMLHTLDLSYNNLKIINDKDLYNFSQLSNLDLSHNNNLKANITLKDIQTLKTLSIVGILNTIKFDVCISLLFLDVSKLNINNIMSLGITNLYNLIALVITNNSIQTLEVGSFSNLTKLETLDLSFNRLRSIQPGVFKDNNYLKTLNISHNQLTSLNYGIFHGLESLNFLDVSYNKLEELQSERFYGVQSLRTLIVDFNQISKISLEEFSDYLLLLSIGGNPISCNDLIKFKIGHTNTKVTALKLYEVSNDIIDGVPCSGKIALKTSKSADNVKINENVLTEIRDVLISISSKLTDKEAINESYIVQNENTTKFDMVIDSFNETKTTLYDLARALNISNRLIEMYINVTSYESIDRRQTNNFTNILLDRILHVLATKNSSVLQFQDRVNTTSFTDKQKQEIDHSFMVQKQNFLSEINEKISHITKSIGPTSSKSLSEEKALISELSARLLYTEICTFFILTIILGFIIYMVYNRVITPRRISISTQGISNVIDNSVL